MPPAIIGGVIAGAGAIGAAALGSSAQKKATKQATDAQAAATAQNNALQREVYASNQANLAPYRDQGVLASATRNALLGLGGDAQAAGKAYQTFLDSGVYAHQFGEGMRALNSGFAGRGVLNSGAAAKAAIAYGQDRAKGALAGYLGYLGEQQGTGLSAAGALAGVSTGYAGSVAANNAALADVRGNAALANGQAQTSLYGTAAGALGQIGGSWLTSYAGGFGARNPYGIAGSDGIY